ACRAREERSETRQAHERVRDARDDEHDAAEQSCLRAPPDLDAWRRGWRAYAAGAAHLRSVRARRGQVHRLGAALPEHRRFLGTAARSRRQRLARNHHHAVPEGVTVLRRILILIAVLLGLGPLVSAAGP